MDKSLNRTTQSPFIMVLFGGTGDLARRKILPSLYSLYLKGYLPPLFKILATGRRASSPEAYFNQVKEFLGDGDTVAAFLGHIEYLQMDLQEISAFQALKDRIHILESTTHKECVSKLYYMSLTPDVLASAISNLGQVGLHIGCGEEGKWSRIIIEKPFGHDLTSAKGLNELLLKYFQEEQIYRIDHYLGKELVQTILSMRFANSMFYPLLSNQFVERIEINAFETLGMEGRGHFYDQTGALRDYVQSHLLQLIALATMNEPDNFSALELRNKKVEALGALRMFDEQSIRTNMQHGQYEGYRQEPQVHPQSLTETYVEFTTYVNLPSWQGVPIVAKHGKKMGVKQTAINFVMKPHCGKLYCDFQSESMDLRDDVHHNILSILLSPEEGFRLRTNIKQVGFGTALREVNLAYSYNDTEGDIPDAYERLLMDAISGDQSLFIRSDEIEASWRWVDCVFELWERYKPELIVYPQGARGMR